MKLLKDWTLFERLWLLISVALLCVSSYLWKSPWYGYVSAISGMICVVLVAKGKISNYYFGLVNCIAYAYVAYTWQLYGEVMLNLIYFLPMQFVGFFFWNKNKQTDNNVRIQILSISQKAFLLLLCCTAIIMYALFLNYLKGNLPWIDSTSTVLSVIAMILMAMRYAEQWILWIIVDVVSVIMWFVVVFHQNGTQDIGALIMWSAFLINAIYGYFNWLKMNRNRMA